jgi:hypothetical protein
MLWAPREGEPGRCYQAQLANAQANLNRYTPLEQKGFATSQLLDTQEAQVAHWAAPGLPEALWFDHAASFCSFVMA